MVEGDETMYCKVKRCGMVHTMVRDGDFMKRSLIEGEGGGCFIKREGGGCFIKGKGGSVS